MRRFRLVTCVLGLLFSFVPLRAAPAAQPSAAAAIETTLPTEGEHIRQLAFDGDEKTLGLFDTEDGAVTAIAQQLSVTKST